MSKAKNILNTLSSDELPVLTAIGNKKGIKHSELLSNPDIVAWDFLKPVLISLATRNLVEVHRGFGGWQPLHVAFDDDSDGKTADLTAGGWRYKLTSVGYELLKRETAEKPAEKEQNAIPAKGWWITTLFKNIIEKGWQIFTKSFWDSVFDKWGPK